MKFDAWPVLPPGLGRGPLSSSTMSVQPSRERWPTRQLPTIPAPMTTACAWVGRSVTGGFLPRRPAAATRGPIDPETPARGAAYAARSGGVARSVAATGPAGGRVATDEGTEVARQAPATPRRLWQLEAARGFA